MNQIEQLDRRGNESREVVDMRQTCTNTTDRPRRSLRSWTMFGLSRASILTIIFVIVIQILVLSNGTHSAKTFYMHWNTSNSM
jgi:hypothetical protein